MALAPLALLLASCSQNMPQGDGTLALLVSEQIDCDTAKEDSSALDRYLEKTQSGASDVYLDGIICISDSAVYASADNQLPPIGSISAGAYPFFKSQNNMAAISIASDNHGIVWVPINDGSEIITSGEQK